MKPESLDDMTTKKPRPEGFWCGLLNFLSTFGTSTIGFPCVNAKNLNAEFLTCQIKAGVQNLHQTL